MQYQLDGRVYFNKTYVQNSLTMVQTEENYSFALKNSNLMQDTIKITVQLMGNVVDYDRTFRAEVIADSTTAESPLHYELLEGTMKAGEYLSYLPVVIKRTADTQDHYVTLKVRLIDSPDLHTGHPGSLEYRVNWGDILMRPAHWPDFFWGPYSVNKYRFAIDVLGTTDWPQATRFEQGPNTYTAGELQLFASQLNAAYAAYREANGPIYVNDNAEEKVEIYYSM